MTDEEKQRELQGTLAQIELQKSRMEGLAGQMRLIETALAELSETRKALTELEKGRKDVGILVPIGGGSYIKARIEDAENIIVGVGAGVSIEKKITEAGKILDKREKDYTATLEKLKTAFVGVSSKISELNDSAEDLAGRLSGGR